MLPTYNNIGSGTILLISVRLMRVFAVGGEYGRCRTYVRRTRLTASEVFTSWIKTTANRLFSRCSFILGTQPGREGFAAGLALRYGW